MKTATSTCLIILLVCSLLTSHSQTFQISNLSIQEGMPSAEVYNSIQDKKGFIWFATDNGVVRFDGLEMKAYHIKQGLVDPVVFGFYEDRYGRIWFRSYSGKLAYFENDQIHAYPYNKQITEKVSRTLTYAMYIDEADELWLSSSSDIIHVNKNGSVTTQTFNLYTAFAQSKDKSFIYGLTGPIPDLKFFNIDSKLFPLELTGKGYPTQVMQCIHWLDVTLFSIGSNIFLFDGEQLINRFTSEYPIISLSTDNNNNLWVGYLNKGVERFTDTSFSNSWKPTIFMDKSVTSVLEDKEGGLWFSTLENGVFYAPKQTIETITFENQKKLTSVIRDSRFILAGDINGNLLAIDPQKKTIAWRKNYPSSILSLYQDNNRNQWVSTRGGSFVYDKSFTELLHNSTLAIIDFTELPNGDLWTVGGALVIKVKNLQASSATRLNDILRGILVTDSNIFVAGRTGLKIYTSKMQLKAEPAHLANLKITDIKRVNDSTLLLATTGSGFLLLSEKTLKIKRFDSENNLMANTVHSVLIDKKNLWLGTEKGLIKTSIPDLVNDHASFQYLTQQSGLASNKVTFLVRGHEAVWAFTEKGVSIIPDSMENFSNTNPTFYLKNITVNQDPFDIAKQQELQYDQNNIGISFGFISFNNNQNIRTRFRLSPTEPWVYTEQREFQFYSLSPGSYSLVLEYSVDNNEWKTAIDQLAFFINPPWWKAWYYQLIMIIIVAAIALLYVRGRLKVSRERQEYLAVINNQQQKLLQTEIQTIERERGRIAKDLHDTVGTNLAAIKMMVSQLLRKHHEPLSENVENQLQDVIKETKELIYNLVPPGLERFGLFVLTRNHIAKLNHSTQTQIDLSTFGQDVYHADRNIIIFRIIQELLSNSLKHAHATTISIAINTFDDHVNILYEDNGIGFSEVDNKEGFGLLNIQSRVESLQGDINFESGHSGTAYSINIPYTHDQDKDRTRG